MFSSLFLPLDFQRQPFALRLDPGKPIGAVNCPAGAIERWDAMISSRRLNCSEMVHLDKVGCRCD